eukprot:scaffold2549_cov150-Skeletonema_dohrnii-CCMP3373.AAC.2
MAVNHDTSGICQSSGTMYRLKLDVPPYKHKSRGATCNKSSDAPLLRLENDYDYDAAWIFTAGF